MNYNFTKGVPVRMHAEFAKLFFRTWLVVRRASSETRYIVLVLI